MRCMRIMLLRGWFSGHRQSFHDRTHEVRLSSSVLAHPKMPNALSLIMVPSIRHQFGSGKVPFI